MKTLQQVALRQQALFIPQAMIKPERGTMVATTAVFVANLAKLGYGVSEPLLHALNQTTPAFHSRVLADMREKLGLKKNWTPLVKGWDTPTGESRADHLITFFVNLFQGKGTKLACGHTIPANTFPLERYNGCPFCGMPFQVQDAVYVGQGSKLKLLDLWTETEATQFLLDLLASKTALDATQVDSLKILLTEVPVPEKLSVGMKETQMLLIDHYVAINEPGKAQLFFATPTDVLRYLWYKHTGFLQIIAPKTIIKRTARNQRHIGYAGGNKQAVYRSMADLKLKYSRKDCATVAEWLNRLDMDAEKMCETMHPKRGMWVRFIRALRLAEYAKKPGFERLKDVLDKFYNNQYTVWAGRVNHYRLRYEMDETLALLKQRPGLFARSLFANMLWFGTEPVIEAFSEVVDKVPARLVFTLNMYADGYFDEQANRSVKPLGGVNKTVDSHPLLSLYTHEDLERMKRAVEGLTHVAVKKRFAAVPTTHKTIYIEPVLYKIPLSIGDRADTVQDLSAVLMGTRFPVEGNSVRLFMQWGTGLPAQHMDMDLSCRIAYDDHSEYCSYSRLVATGCKHSGDIRSIPNQVGTAEYIELDVETLKKTGARYVSFTCNAYSFGAITPNLVVGWMNSRNPMKISEKSGVAYDPSCVQQQVRVAKSLVKGMVFGVLDVAASEIVWLELPFEGQLVQDLGSKNVETFLRKLANKITIGELLEIKAEAQNLHLVKTEAEADEAYTHQWATNTAAVTKLLID